MTIHEAFEDGKKAFLDGMDIQHMPGHYSTIEQENYIEGYKQMEAKGEFEEPDDYDLEDPSLTELDFN